MGDTDTTAARGGSGSRAACPPDRARWGALGDRSCGRDAGRKADPRVCWRAGNRQDRTPQPPVRARRRGSYLVLAGQATELERDIAVHAFHRRVRRLPASRAGPGLALLDAGELTELGAHLPVDGSQERAGRPRERAPPCVSRCFRAAHRARPLDARAARARRRSLGRCRLTGVALLPPSATSAGSGSDRVRVPRPARTGPPLSGNRGRDADRGARAAGARASHARRGRGADRRRPSRQSSARCSTARAGETRSTSASCSASDSGAIARLRSPT